MVVIARKWGLQTDESVFRKHFMLLVKELK